jgi:hypothetical protein
MDAPAVVDRSARHYIGITGSVTMTSFAAVADRIPELFARLGARAGWHLPAHRSSATAA